MNTERKVLLVDDDADLVAINEAVFAARGFAVDKAYNGGAGFDRARDGRPDVIVLDVMMSTNSEGFDLARRLRGDDATRGIPLIMVTSVNSTVPFTFEPDGVFLPVDRFLEKPVPPETLVAEVEGILANHPRAGS